MNADVFWTWLKVEAAITLLSIPIFLYFDWGWRSMGLAVVVFCFCEVARDTWILNRNEPWVKKLRGIKNGEAH